MTESRARGRHEARGQPPLRLSGRSGLLIRPAILVGGLVVGLAVAAWHWIVTTTVLGARLPTAVHVLLIAVFLGVVLTVVIIAWWLGTREVARRSQARRRQWRDEWL